MMAPVRGFVDVVAYGSPAAAAHGRTPARAARTRRAPSSDGAHVRLAMAVAARTVGGLCRWLSAGRASVAEQRTELRHSTSAQPLSHYCLPTRSTQAHACLLQCCRRRAPRATWRSSPLLSLRATGPPSRTPRRSARTRRRRWRLPRQRRACVAAGRSRRRGGRSTAGGAAPLPPSPRPLTRPPPQRAGPRLPRARCCGEGGGAEGCEGAVGRPRRAGARGQADAHRPHRRAGAAARRHAAGQTGARA